MIFELFKTVKAFDGEASLVFETDLDGTPNHGDRVMWDCANEFGETVDFIEWSAGYWPRIYCTPYSRTQEFDYDHDEFGGIRRACLQEEIGCELMAGWRVFERRTTWSSQLARWVEPQKWHDDFALAKTI